MRSRLVKIFAVIVIVLSFVGFALCMGNEKIVNRTFKTKVVMKNGEVSAVEDVHNGAEYSSKSLQDTIVIDEEGDYILSANCTNDTAGLITGCILYDEADKVQFYCSGESFQVESGEISLKEGTYRVEWQFIANQEELEQLNKAGNAEVVDAEAYEFAENGTWDLRVECNVKKAGTTSIYYILGCVCGVVAGLAFCVVVVWLIRKVGGKVDLNCKKGAYDERQMLARGEAYKYAFFTLMIGVVVVCLLNDIAKIPFFMSIGGMYIIVCISLGVFATICIVKDAYMSLYENAKGVCMLFGVIGLLNVAIGIINIAHGTALLENGVLTVDCLNLVVGVLFLYLLIVFGARVIYNSKQPEEDEE